MSPAESILAALQRQGFGVVITEDGDAAIVTADGRRSHRIAAAALEDTPDGLRRLRIMVAGLEYLEDFTAPPGFWAE